MPRLDRHVQGRRRRRALALGAEMVNDVTALRGDPALAGVVADAGAYLCLMHMQGEPRTMQDAPRYDDVVSEVAPFLEERLAFAVAPGSPRSAICLDPGHRLRQDARPEPRARAPARRDRRARPPGARRPLAQEHARPLLGDPGGGVGTDAASVGAAVAAFDRGASIFRVHDVRAHVEALAVAAAVERGTVPRDGSSSAVWSCTGSTACSRRSGAPGSGSSSTSSSSSADAGAPRATASRTQSTTARWSPIVREVSDGRRSSCSRRSPRRSLMRCSRGFAVASRAGAVRKPDVELGLPVEHAAVVVERSLALYAATRASRVGRVQRRAPPGVTTRYAQRPLRRVREHEPLACGRALAASASGTSTANRSDDASCAGPEQREVAVGRGQRHRHASSAGSQTR